jgi:hypothetical protein
LTDWPSRVLRIVTTSGTIMRTFVVLVALCIVLQGCASTIMQSYVQQDLRTVMLDYGPPENAFDMPDGTRAFQWIMGKSRGTAASAFSTTNASVGSGAGSWVTSNTTITGGRAIESKCIYTLFARWEESTKGWAVVSFHKPPFMCE